MKNILYFDSALKASQALFTIESNLKNIDFNISKRTKDKWELMIEPHNPNSEYKNIINYIKHRFANKYLS